MQFGSSEIVSADAGLDVALYTYGVMQLVPPQDEVRIIDFSFTPLLVGLNLNMYIESCSLTVTSVYMTLNHGFITSNRM